MLKPNDAVQNGLDFESAIFLACLAGVISNRNIVVGGFADNVELRAFCEGMIDSAFDFTKLAVDKLKNIQGSGESHAEL